MKHSTAIILWTLFLCALIGTLGYLFIQVDIIKNNFKMYSDLGQAKLSGRINGVYSSSGVMKVLVEGRSWPEVMETCSHEYLHYKWGREHFQNVNQS